MEKESLLLTKKRTKLNLQCKTGQIIQFVNKDEAICFGNKCSQGRNEKAKLLHVSFLLQFFFKGELLSNIQNSFQEQVDQLGIRTKNENDAEFEYISPLAL